MPLVKATCTNCNANLQVDSAKDAAICPYCGTAYIVEKAINHHSVVNHIQADVVNVHGCVNSGFDIRAGVLIKYTGSDIDVTIPNGVVEIGSQAFRDQQYIVNVNIPEGVKIIRSCAFWGCSGLRSIHLPSTLATIESSAFSYSGLVSVTIPKGITVLNGFEACSELNEIDIPPTVTEIRGLGRNRFKNFEIPNTVKIIGQAAFSGCKELERITIPRSVVEISTQAFEECTSLSNILIPTSVTSIGSSAFRACKSLEEVYIPNSVTTIGGGAFAECTSLKKVILPDNLSIIESYLFGGCSQLSDIHFPTCHYFAQSNSFAYTRWENDRRNAWRYKRVCDRCGGSFKGVFEKHCTRCGEKKQY